MTKRQDNKITSLHDPRMDNVLQYGSSDPRSGGESQKSQQIGPMTNEIQAKPAHLTDLDIWAASAAHSRQWHFLARNAKTGKAGRCGIAGPRR